MSGGGILAVVITAAVLVTILALTGAYGPFYARVKAFWNRAKAVISGPQNKEHH